MPDQTSLVLKNLAFQFIVFYAIITLSSYNADGIQNIVASSSPRAIVQHILSDFKGKH